MKKEKLFSTKEIAIKFGSWISDQKITTNHYGLYGEAHRGNFGATMDELFNVFLMNNYIEDPDAIVETAPTILPRKFLVCC